MDVKLGSGLLLATMQVGVNLGHVQLPTLWVEHIGKPWNRMYVETVLVATVCDGQCPVSYAIEFLCLLRQLLHLQKWALVTKTKGPCTGLKCPSLGTCGCFARLVPRLQ